MATQAASDVQLHTGPARGVLALTAGASIPQTTPIRGLWIQTGGDIVLKFPDDSQATFTVADKTILPVSPSQIVSAGTNASGFIGFL